MGLIIFLYTVVGVLLGKIWAGGDFIYWKDNRLQFTLSILSYIAIAVFSILCGLKLAVIHT